MLTQKSDMPRQCTKRPASIPSKPPAQPPGSGLGPPQVGGPSSAGGGSLAHVEAVQRAQHKERRVRGRPVRKVAADSAQPGVLRRARLRRSIHQKLIAWTDMSMQDALTCWKVCGHTLDPCPHTIRCRGGAWHHLHQERRLPMLLQARGSMGQLHGRVPKSRLTESMVCVAGGHAARTCNARQPGDSLTGTAASACRVQHHVSSTCGERHLQDEVEAAGGGAIGDWRAGGDVGRRAGAIGDAPDGGVPEAVRAALQRLRLRRILLLRFLLLLLPCSPPQQQHCFPAPANIARHVLSA